MQMMNVLLFGLIVSVVTYYQVRKLFRNREVRVGSIYIALMIMVMLMYAFVFLNKKSSFNPMSLFSIPLEQIGRYFIDN